MNDLKIFNNEEFGDIRSILIDNEPWFVGKDVATALGYKKPTDAVRKKVDCEDRGISKMETPSGTQDMTIINESGLYSLILSSKLPSAKRFKHWVTAEVLPSIRKSGKYEQPQDRNTLIAKALVEANRLLGIKDEQIRSLQEKSSYLDIILGSPDDVLASQIAADYGMTATRFNALLHDLGIQRKVKQQWILCKEYCDQGYMCTVTRPVNAKDGRRHVNIRSRWTQLGRKWLYGVLKENGLLPVIERDEKELRYLSHTEISRRLNIPRALVSKLLIDADLMFKFLNDGKYYLTDKGWDYCRVKSFTKNGVAHHTPQWKETVLPVLKERIAIHEGNVQY